MLTIVFKNDDLEDLMEVKLPIDCEIEKVKCLIDCCLKYPKQATHCIIEDKDGKLYFLDLKSGELEEI